MGRSGIKSLLNYDSAPPHLRGCLLENVRKHYARELDESLRADYHTARDLALNEILMQQQHQHQEEQMMMGLHIRHSRWHNSMGGRVTYPYQPSVGRHSTFLMSSSARPSSETGFFESNSRDPIREPLQVARDSAATVSAPTGTNTTTTTTAGPGTSTTTTATSRGAGTQLIVTVERSMHRMGGGGSDGVNSDTGAISQDYNELADRVLGAWRYMMSMRPRSTSLQQQQQAPTVSSLDTTTNPTTATRDLDAVPYAAFFPSDSHITPAFASSDSDDDGVSQPGSVIVSDNGNEDSSQQRCPPIVLDHDDGVDRGRQQSTSMTPVPVLLPRLMSVQPVAGVDCAQVVRSSDAVKLIVYIYCRNVQSLDFAVGGEENRGWMSSIGGDVMPSEMVSWHIKGLEYDLGRVSAEGAGGEVLFEMSQEQVMI